MSSSSHHYHTASEPHSYNIQAKLRNGILSIYVHDTMSNSQWRQEFTQISFPGHKLYDVAKSLINSIKLMINNNNPSSNKAIAILVYNQWCYLTIYNCNIPSFALRPIQITNTNTNVSTISTNPKQKQKQSQDVNKPSKPSNSHKHQFPTRPLPSLPIAHRMATNISSPSCSNSDSFDSSDSSIIDSIFSNDGHRKKKRKSKKNANSGKPFKICLNGIVIDDMINHVFEQQLAEEEYYDEEEDQDHDDDDEEYINATYYDPNYLAISPYYDDY